MKHYRLKTLLLGDGAVGKTSLLRRFVEQKFSDEYIATIGANIKKKRIEYPNQDTTVDLMIADLLGQKGYENTQKMNMRNSNSAFLVSDLTRYETVESIEEYWIPLLKDVLNETPPLIFLANKADLVEFDGEETKEFRTELLKLSEKYDAKFYFTSAKTGDNVEKAFNEIGLASIKGNTDNFYFHNLYKIDKNEISSKQALDLFKSQFYLEIGNEEFANSILKKQLDDAGIKITDEEHSRESLNKLVEKMHDINKEFMLVKEADKIYKRRKAILNKIKN